MEFFSQWLTVWCLDSEQLLDCAGCPAYMVVLKPASGCLTKPRDITQGLPAPGLCLGELISRQKPGIPKFKGSFQKVLESSFLS